MFDSPLRTLLPALALLAAGPAHHAGAQSPGPSFDRLDSDGNGVISEEEARARRGLSQLMPHFDDDGDGSLDSEEFRALIQDAVQASVPSGTGAPAGEAKNNPEPQKMETPEEAEDNLD